jgi:archaeal type IV pilus assembly protein PilA
MMQHRDSAVSPVVGVMLMLVVTIIIAAVVSAFAGGLASEQHKTPQVTISAKGVIENIGGTIDPDTYELSYPDGYTAKNGILFENTGGDTFSLSDIAIQLQTQDTKYTITSTDELPDTSILPNGTTNGGYFQKIGNTSLADVMIHPGDQFMLYADANAKGVTYPAGPTWDASTYGPKLSWKPSGASNGIGIYLDSKVQYSIIDRVSNKVMTKGDLVLN